MRPFPLPRHLPAGVLLACALALLVPARSAGVLPAPSGGGAPAPPREPAPRQEPAQEPATAPAAPAEFKLLASDGSENDEFGRHVALDRSTVLVGAGGVDEKGEEAGAVYVYQGSGGRWAEVAKLMASDGIEDDHFGDAVAISGDLALVGAPRADVEELAEAGAVYVFERQDGAWLRVETARLVAPTPAAGDRLGSVVALAGGVAVAGAPFAGDGGAVHLFAGDGDDWEPTAMLTPADGGGRFGSAVAADGATLLVGAPTAGGQGAVHVFEDTGTGAGWSEATRLTASDGAVGDLFGAALALSGDTAFVGATGHDEGGPAAGAVYVFQRGADGWSQTAKLVASDAGADDLFGYSMSVSGDTLVVGAIGEDDAGSASGAVYVFRRGEEGWSEVRKLNASDAAGDDLFGISLSLQGTTLATGAPGDDDRGVSSGAAYVLEGIGTAPATDDPGGR